MPRKTVDPDFRIYVDPSCLSTPMDDENISAPAVEGETKGEEGKELVLHEGDNHGVEDVKDNLPVSDIPVSGQTDEQNIAVDIPQDIPIDDIANSAPEAEAAEPLEEGEFEEMTTHNSPSGTAGIDAAAEEDDHEHNISKGPGTGGEEEVHADDDGEGEPTPRRTQIPDAVDEDEGTVSPPRSERRASLRTEALIQAAARAVVARIERRSGDRISLEQGDEDDGDRSVSTDTYGLSGTELSYETHSDHSRRESSESHLLPSASSHPSDGEGGDSSSHHDPDDDVFSDRSPRSSLGSYDGSHDGSHHDPKNSEPSDTERGMKDTRSSRISGVSAISGLSQYDKEDFVPTVRGTPRMPFRTPSDIRAMQMSSPPPSVFSGASPRSNKRHTGVSAGFPTISRLGSPNVSAQYSPKGKSTPTRFKIRKEAPLVLLHVTLMPLRWAWGDVLNRLESTRDGVGAFEPSEQFKTLRDAWRQLQERVGDTVLERGILLPHPQNDYEVLEERLLEALELPLRRRARILECGHYLGPANEMGLADEEDGDESEDDYNHSSRAARAAEKRHWCKTCRGEIRYDELGPGRIFRVKVYASNGLMKAGAWGACWKEMERVDAEVEPIVDPAVQSELERLATAQMEDDIRQERQRQEAEDQLHAEAEVQREEETPYPDHAHVLSSPPAPTIHLHASPPQPPTASSHIGPQTGVDEDRRRRDEERLREIYGHTPPPASPGEGVDEPATTSPSTASHTHTHQHPHAKPPPHVPGAYVAAPTPPSPCEQAFERRQQRQGRPRHYQTLSLPELLLEAVKVLARDRRNVAIAALAVLVLLLAVRTAPPEPAPSTVIQGGGRAGEYADEEWRVVLGDRAGENAAKSPSPESVVVTMSAGEGTQTATAVDETHRVPVSATQASSAPVVERQQQQRAESKAVEVPDASPAAVVDKEVETELETVTEKKVVRIVETVTETETATVKVSVTATSTETAASVSTAEDAAGGEVGEEGAGEV